MNLLGIGSIIDGVGKIADDLFTSDEERLKLAIQEKAIDAELVKGQLDINKEEAKHKSLFIAGWRPFIGWVGGIALAYQFVIYPILIWMFALLQAQDVIPCNLDDVKEAMKNSKTVIDNFSCTFGPPPVFDAGPLFAIIMGMLGIGGMRSFDKLKKTDTKGIE